MRECIFMDAIKVCVVVCVSVCARVLFVCHDSVCKLVSSHPSVLCSYKSPQFSLMWLMKQPLPLSPMPVATAAYLNANDYQEKVPM